jgi:exodeoxyribonuclease VII small subunit
MGPEAQLASRASTASADAGDSDPVGGSAALGPAFEQVLQELEALVTQLESGDLPLDEALRTFERGVRLTRECQSALSSAQQKVQMLLQRGDRIVVEEFDATAAETGAAASGSS